MPANGVLCLVQNIVVVMIHVPCVIKGRTEFVHVQVDLGVNLGRRAGEPSDNIIGIIGRMR
jgi:hypothetical protein